MVRVHSGLPFNKARNYQGLMCLRTHALCRSDTDRGTITAR